MSNLQEFTDKMKDLLMSAYGEFGCSKIEEFTDINSHNIPAVLIQDYLKKKPLDWGNTLVRNFTIDPTDIKHIISQMGEKRLDSEWNQDGFNQTYEEALERIYRSIYVEVIPKVNLNLKFVPFSDSIRAIQEVLTEDCFDFMSIGKLAEAFPRDKNRLYFTYQKEKTTQKHDYGFAIIAESYPGQIDFRYPTLGSYAAPTFLFSFFDSDPLYHYNVIENVSKKLQKL
ncbi:MAG: hypothetical protein QXY90_04890 [Candidatus Anstonellales archaeon]